MTSYNFIFLVVISPWLIWNSFLFYYATIYDKKFNFFIKKNTEIFKYLALLGLIICISIYLFLFRLLGKKRSFNVYESFEILDVYLSFLTISDMVFLAMFFMFVLIFWLLMLGWVYLGIRRRILALYLYFLQFRLMNDFFTFLSRSKLNSHFYLTKRVKIFTNNVTIYTIAWYLWPIGPRMIRKTLFRFILPYVLIFDILTNNGIITKFFMILPWYYVYSVIKACFMLLYQIQKPENIDISIKMYGYGTRYDTSSNRTKAFQVQQKQKTGK